MPMRAVHRASAFVLASFVLLHLANHVAGFRGLGRAPSGAQVLRYAYQGW